MAVSDRNYNLDWLGKTPDGWNKNKIKHLVSVRRESRLISEKDQPFIGPKNIEPGTGRYLPDKQQLTAEKYDICKQGDLLYSKAHPELAKAIIASESSLCSGEFIVISNCRIDKRWLFYYMLTDEFTQAAVSTIHGTSIPRADWGLLSNFFIVYPKKDQMEKILVYINRKCDEIDRAIDVLRKMILDSNAYKEATITKVVTGSAVSRENWRTTKLKYVANLMPDKTSGKITPEDEVTYVQVENVKEGVIKPQFKTFSELPSPFVRFYPGDILLAKLSSCFKNNSIAIAGEMPFSIGFACRELYVIRCFDIDNRFLYYWLRNSKFRHNAIASVYGTADMLRVPKGFLENIKLEIPSRRTQSIIADHLDRTCAQIDESIVKCEEQIEMLLTHRKRLIFDYVTGKKSIDKAFKL